MSDLEKGGGGKGEKLSSGQDFEQTVRYSEQLLAGIRAGGISLNTSPNRNARPLTAEIYDDYETDDLVNLFSVMIERARLHQRQALDFPEKSIERAEAELLASAAGEDLPDIIAAVEARLSAGPLQKN